MKNYYQILGLSASSSDGDIKNAWRKAAMKFHPDRNKDPQAENKFKEIKLAYETLSDPKLRREHDEKINFSSNFYFKSPERSGRSFLDTLSPQNNDHLPVTFIAIGFWEGVFGGSKNVLMWLNAGGKIREASVSVKFSAGLKNGEKIHILTNIGEGFLKVSFLDSAGFGRNGLDLQVEAPIPFSVLLQGGSFLFPHWEGDLNIKIPAHSQDGLCLRLLNKGVKRNTGGWVIIGDLYISFRSMTFKGCDKPASSKIDILTELKKEEDKKMNEWARAIRANWSDYKSK